MRKSTATAMAALLVCGTATGCAGTEATENGVPKVSVSVTHPEDLYGLPWEVGRKQHLFEDAGVVVEKIVPSSGGGTTLQNVVSGQLPFGEVATGAVVNGAREGAPVKVIGGGIQSVFDVEWAVPADSELRTAEQAKKARWGYTNEGSVTEAMSHLVPENAGMDLPDSARTSTGGSGEGIALLEAGDVDLAYASPRTLAENEDTLRSVIRSDEFVPAYQQTMIISSRDYAQQHPDTAKALLSGYAKAVEWIYAHPEKAADMWAAAADMDKADARSILDDAVEAEHWNVAYNPEALKAAAKGLKATDGLKTVDWRDLLTQEYLPADHKGQIPG
jgi:NitT/TauT family transport system substrate-binding protein